MDEFLGDSEKIVYPIIIKTMEQHRETVADKWRATLKNDGAYAHHASSYKECKKLGKLSWTWRKVFRAIRVDPAMRKEFSVFEFGSGGGKNAS